jgi:hypothetical protein
MSNWVPVNFLAVAPLSVASSFGCGDAGRY